MSACGCVHLRGPPENPALVRFTVSSHSPNLRRNVCTTGLNEVCSARCIISPTPNTLLHGASGQTRASYAVTPVSCPPRKSRTGPRGPQLPPALSPRCSGYIQTFSSHEVWLKPSSKVALLPGGISGGLSGSLWWDRCPWLLLIFCPLLVTALLGLARSAQSYCGSESKGRGSGLQDL